MNTKDAPSARSETRPRLFAAYRLHPKQGPNLPSSSPAHSDQGLDHVPAEFSASAQPPTLAFISLVGPPHRAGARRPSLSGDRTHSSLRTAAPPGGLLASPRCWYIPLVTRRSHFLLTSCIALAACGQVAPPTTVEAPSGAAAMLFVEHRSAETPTATAQIGGRFVQFRGMTAEALPELVGTPRLPSATEGCVERDRKSVV